MITSDTLLKSLFGDLVGKGAIVTGGASGIGRAVAETLVAAGMKVAIFDRDLAAATSAADEIGPNGAFPVECDVTSNVSVASAMESAKAAFGEVPLYVLVNSAGVVVPDGENGPDLAASEKMWQVNAQGTQRMILAVAPILEANGGGSIVNIGSVAGSLGIYRRSGYCASKGAVHSMTESEALRLGPKGIRVNAIAPGRVFTSLVVGYLSKSTTPEADFRRSCSTQLGGVMGRPTDVAKSALFLASRLASPMCNGAILDLSDGWNAGFHPDQANMPPAFEEFRKQVREETGLPV